MRLPVTPRPFFWPLMRLPATLRALSCPFQTWNRLVRRHLIRVDRSTPVVYPHYWWLKNVAHPEFQAKGPPEYDLATVELWLHKGQERARRVAGNLIKGQKKGRGVTGSLIYEHLLKNNMLVSCLGFADGLG